MALAGLAFGLGAASKWTGIYAGAGLGRAVSGRALCALAAERPGFRAEFRTAAVGGVLFYVLLPLCLYIGPICRTGGAIRRSAQRLVAVPGVDVQLPCDS